MAIENVNNGIRRITRRVKHWRDLVAALRARDAASAHSLANQERAA